MYNARLLTSQKRGEVLDDPYLRQLCCHPLLSCETKEALEGCGSLTEIHKSMQKQTKVIIDDTQAEIDKLEERLKYLADFVDDEQKNILPIYEENEDCPDYIAMNRATKSLLTRKTKQLNNLQKALELYTTGGSGASGDVKLSDITDTTKASKEISALDKLEIVDDGKESGAESGTNPEDMQYLIQIYGTKMGHLIHYFKNDFQKNSQDCAIIFSQWDTLLKNIQTTLKQNGIASSCCKGNIFQKNKAVEKFREKSKGMRILLLSTKYAASGLDLMEANKIILFDPVYGTEKFKHGIEGQAIGRAARIGQKRTIEVIRFLMKDTIEEEIHYSMVPKDQIKKIKVI
jgi:SNF2 family DNA or RNA helicase